MKPKNNPDFDIAKEYYLPNVIITMLCEDYLDNKEKQFEIDFCHNPDYIVLSTYLGKGKEKVLKKYQLQRGHPLYNEFLPYSLRNKEVKKKKK